MHKRILAGESALAHAGLITLSTGGLKQIWTLHMLTPITEGVPVAYYWNPYADKPFLTKETDSGYLLPTQERALVEYMMFAHYFSEEFLLEGLQTYDEVFDGDFSEIYKVADFMKVREDVISHWIREAQEYDRI